MRKRGEMAYVRIWNSKVLGMARERAEMQIKRKYKKK